MTTTLDVSQDFLNFDNTEEVTVSLIRTTGTTARTVDNGLRRGTTLNDSQIAGVQLGSNSRVWNIPNEQLTSGDEIVAGDTITDEDSVVWKVKGVSFLTFETRWRCVCTKQK